MSANICQTDCAVAAKYIKFLTQLPVSWKAAQFDKIASAIGSLQSIIDKSQMFHPAEVIKRYLLRVIQSGVNTF